MAKKQKTRVVAYNPLDKLNLAKSIESELLGRPADSLASIKDISGAGVYVIYYTGPFTAYAPVAKANAGGNFSKPIYVGKAIPKGGRKGGLAKDVASTGKALLDRLKQHASSISEAENLELEHFFVRHLVVDDIWIPLGENMLIETFQPVWNRVIDGFGNKDPGQRRAHSTNRHRIFCTLAENSQRNYRQEQYFADRPREPRPGQLDATTRASPIAVPVVFMLSSCVSVFMLSSCCLHAVFLLLLLSSVMSALYTQTHACT